ncbi:MAG: circadian clock KaiB family protein [Ferruginibacter sp.]
MNYQEQITADTEKINNNYVLKLFVTGASPNSVRAIANIKKICDTHLAGSYTLEIIDVYQQPEMAQQAQLVALPMLLKSSPLPVRRLIGDMSDSERILAAFGLNNI